jgi:hypothetical protein
MKTLKKLTVLAASLPLVAGCSSISATDSTKVAEAIGTIQPSRKDTCETLRQIAQQTSRIETIKQGKEVVFASPKCEPKTS